MEIKSIKHVCAYDRDHGSALVVNGLVVATCNYDEHGSAGTELLGKVMDGIAKISNIYPIEEEVSDEEFLKLVGQQ